MNIRSWKTLTILILLVVIITSSCSLFGGNNNTTNGETPPAPAATGGVTILKTVVPDVELNAAAYLDAWVDENYPAMYSMLTTLSQDALPYDQFENRYHDVATEATLTSVEYEIIQSLTNPTNAQVAYRVTLNSALAGPITRETLMQLSLENGTWRVIWDDSLILPELAGGNTLSMQPFTPTRGIIYDRNGEPLAADSDAVAIQVIPSAVDPDNSNGLINQLSALTGKSAGALRDLIFAEDAPFLTPVGVVSRSKLDSRLDLISPYYDVLRFDDFFTRLYYLGNAGAQSIGYIGALAADEVDEWARRGYPQDAKIGRLGIEAWGEEYLAGKRGGELYVVSPTGERITILARQDAQPSQSIYLTLDAQLQVAAQEAIKDFIGAIVVLERDTGRVLAIVSSPTFDPNSADPANPVSEWSSYFPDDVGRFYNNASQGQFVPGSIFKVISLAAALESSIYTNNSSYFCGSTWDSLGAPLDDWTVEKGLPPSGELQIVQGLMRSCNPWFFEIGFSLFNNGLGSMIAEMARSFGLGSPTGIGVLQEAAGVINDPGTNSPDRPVFDAVQQAIGQSDTLITPIQAAVYTAALGNGGTLYQPQLIERVESTEGTASLQFEPVVNGTLPISEETLAAIREGMRLVIVDPRGTAYRRFPSFPIAVYGKTGTAQLSSDGTILPHAWFIGYTNENRQDKPDLAIAVFIANVGDGSEFAAPIFKRVVEVYFFGNPQSRYPWETQIGVFDPTYFIDTPEDEATPTPEGDSAPVELTPSP